jgi:hypothetical protein
MTSLSIPLLALLPYAAVAAALLTTLALFVSLKVELRRMVNRDRRRFEERLARLEEAAPPTGAVFVPVAAPPGFNLNRRMHALRMLRQGDDPARIAAALNVPVREIELLVRVQRLAAGSTASPAPPPGKEAARTAARAGAGTPPP